MGLTPFPMEERVGAGFTASDESITEECQETNVSSKTNEKDSSKG